MVYSSFCLTKSGLKKGNGQSNPHQDQERGGTAMARDPICGMEVNESQAAASLVHDGQTFYFCARSCYEAFKKAPEKYLAPPKKHGLVGRFLNRLAKAGQETYGNKPPTCH